MSDTTGNLRRKIDSAGDLQSVVRTMKALAAASIGQYKQSVRALGGYYHTVVPGLGLCFRGTGSAALRTGETRQKDAGAISAVVFGSDQGLAGHALRHGRGTQLIGKTTDLALETDGVRRSLPLSPADFAHRYPVCLGPSSYPDRPFQDDAAR